MLQTSRRAAWSRSGTLVGSRRCYGGDVSSLLFQSALIDLLHRRADDVATTVAARIDAQYDHHTVTPMVETSRSA